MTPDVIVIGAGFGGLGAALRLSELGAKVIVLERLAYPGGCAGSFERRGFSFEAGATLSSGFGAGQLFQRWIESHHLDVRTEALDPVVELRTPSARLPIDSDRDRFVTRFLQEPGAPRAALSRFFDFQHGVAERLWRLFDDESRFGLGAVLGSLRLAPLVGRTLRSVLGRHRLEKYEPLRVHLDALCQITVQCPAAEAEAPFALAAMDYYFRGVRHVRGGIGSLAWALARCVRALGGEVRFATPASRLFRSRGSWRVSTRREELEAPVVVANLLPQSLRKLAGLEPGDLPSLDRLARRVESGFGAAMIYRVVRAPEGASDSACHLALVRDPGAPFVEGNHVFCSFGAASDTGYRTLTASTHVRPEAGREGRYVSSVQERMRETLRALAPEWEEDVQLEMTASPRTFERFTGRHLGFVGGVPRRAGLDNYRGLFPAPLLPGLHLVGDSVFPGQSTLAAAAGGRMVADGIARRGQRFDASAAMPDQRVSTTRSGQSLGTEPVAR